MVLMNDFKAEPPALREAMLQAVARVLESGWYVLGSEVTSFEEQWASACGVAHGVGVGNGMDAIEISLRAMGIGCGDEVITTPMTAFPTVLAILRAGATPVLADIDPETALLNLESAGRCLTPKTKAVLLVHLYGQVRGMGAWLDFCRQHGVALIEDCAQAHMARWQGRVAGSFGTAGAYSFYPTKNLGAPGDAGMLVTVDAGLAERARQLRNYGQSTRYHHPVLGLNSRLDEIQAAILSARMDWLFEFTARRRAIAHAYREGIHNPRVRHLVKPEEPNAHVYHLYSVNCDDRDALLRHLTTHQIQALVHYPIPIHRQGPCINITRDNSGLRNAEMHSETCLSLPCHPQLSDDEVSHVIKALNEYRG